MIGCVLGGCGPDTAWRPAWDADANGWVMNAWGPSATEVYAVGGSPDSGRMVRYDGEAATEVDVPEVPLLNWVFGFGADDVHAVGNEGTLLRNTGAGWSAVSSPTDQDLWGVWGAAPDDVWAVGGSARLSDGVPTLLHFDGVEWTTQVVPPLTPTGVRALFKVWGSGPNDVYAVGDVGVMIHFDGTEWTEVRTGAGDDLVAVFGTGPDDIVAVGGRSNGLVARFDGTEWRTEFLPGVPGLNGVWMRAPGVAHINGLRGTVGVFRSEPFEFEPAPVDEPLDFHAMFGADGVIVSVGGNLASPSSTRGTAWTRELGDGE